MASKTQNAMPPCPMCGKSRDVVGNVSRDMFRCTRCGVTFDNDPDEGGTHGNRPDQRMIREEERNLQRRRRA